jgi:ketosteroid isomerase-like protein
LLEEKNIPALIDLWADDGINYYPYSSGMSSEKVVGKQAISETWKGIPEGFEKLSFPIQDIYTDVTKQTAIVRCDVHNIMKGGIGRYDNTYVCIFVFNDKGKIKEYYEYFNPITTEVTYGLLRLGLQWIDVSRETSIQMGKLSLFDGLRNRCNIGR